LYTLFTELRLPLSSYAVAGLSWALITLTVAGPETTFTPLFTLLFRQQTHAGAALLVWASALLLVRSGTQPNSSRLALLIGLIGLGTYSDALLLAQAVVPLTLALWLTPHFSATVADRLRFSAALLVPGGLAFALTKISSLLNERQQDLAVQREAVDSLSAFGGFLHATSQETPWLWPAFLAPWLFGLALFSYRRKQLDRGQHLVAVALLLMLPINLAAVLVMDRFQTQAHLRYLIPSVYGVFLLALLVPAIRAARSLAIAGAAVSVGLAIGVTQLAMRPADASLPLATCTFPSSRVVAEYWHAKPLSGERRDLKVWSSTPVGNYNRHAYNPMRAFGPQVFPSVAQALAHPSNGQPFNAAATPTALHRPFELVALRLDRTAIEQRVGPADASYRCGPWLIFRYL
jgi:hypothetical protein